MIEINTNEEIYLINTKNIIYINIYEDTGNLLNIDIHMKNDCKININEEEMNRKKIIDIRNKLNIISL